MTHKKVAEFLSYPSLLVLSITPFIKHEAYIYNYRSSLELTTGFIMYQIKLIKDTEKRADGLLIPPNYASKQILQHRSFVYFTCHNLESSVALQFTKGLTTFPLGLTQHPTLIANKQTNTLDRTVEEAGRCGRSVGRLVICLCSRVFVYIPAPSSVVCPRTLTN